MGHLAALYCYDMEEFRKAEALYFRSIQIGLKLFGEGFSGLEFDYRGLIHLYKKTSVLPRDPHTRYTRSNHLSVWGIVITPYKRVFVIPGIYYSKTSLLRTPGDRQNVFALS